ncbi:EboA domain-containing protein [Streptomyces sp. NPDC050560]|uniref:EboA domain-containing protein n=1 Tax=Streptomyces sp. NPDC050560 TaxID=3365630 RepID=UPI0037A450F6
MNRPAADPTAEGARARLATALDDTARGWLERAIEQAGEAPADGTRPPAWELRFAEAGRRCGPAACDDARLLLLATAHPDSEGLTRLYRRGSAAERRAVLTALPALVPGPEAVPLVEDALRTNDTSIVAAAVGPYAARHLDTHNWRHAVLKCLFTGVPVAAVADLARRAHGDTELARMLGDYAEERLAAGRTVPADLHHVLAMTAPATSEES